ncbi:M48 family metalloprotease [Chitinophaga nivalis]|uniref:M48 family metalloprotease n=1 Tax=Chitinophaga nivalis TaxID=2991709 RepID=A0ABT3IQX6_9BACT|nr:M48 family metalloprotease [Chitinophaga nivalis]MCW3463928.1 M48 family metalloprotease [Chitinophaga nivalis]MCW3486382.1 M48 family metalloprotease [Chitinophaga nivalis]
MPIFKSLLAASLLVLGSVALYAQSPKLYTYQDLSHLYYKQQKDSLTKAWECPGIYRGKATQRKYREIWDSRTEFISKAITDDNYVYDQEIVSYVAGIVDQLITGNKHAIPVKPFLLLDRSASVNAYAVGNGVLAINMGLLTYVRSREELALVIAHELAHNIMQHPEEAMKKRAEWLTSDEYKESLKSILDSKYERLTRLKKIFEEYSFDRNRHQRYHESDADSLAIVLLRNSKIAFDPQVFLRLDSADMEYQLPLIQPVKKYFEAYNLTVEDSWIRKQTKGLSARSGYHAEENSARRDSLKTHPDCGERYKHTLHLKSADSTVTPVPPSIKDRAEKILLWNMYCQGNMAACLYRIMRAKDNGASDTWYDFMFYNVMTHLFKADQELRRFSAIDVKSRESVSPAYFDLQTLLEKIPREQLEQHCKVLYGAAFWKGLSVQERDFKTLLHQFIQQAAETDKARLAQEFAGKHGASMYLEYAQPFIKK